MVPPKKDSFKPSLVMMRTPFRGWPLLPGKWLTADEMPLRAENYAGIASPPLGLVYTSGFHVYRTKAEAEKALAFSQDYGFFRLTDCAVVVQVMVKGITCEGTDGTSPVLVWRKAGLRNLVCKQIMLLPERPKRRKGGSAKAKRAEARVEKL
jgi:hypothetical protein